MNKFELMLAFRHYCMEKKLCYRCSCCQYDVMAEMFSNENNSLKVFRQLGAMLWITSETEMTPDQIENDLEALYLNTIQ